MTIKPFAIERYFAKYEFNARHLLSASDCDGLLMQDLLQHASSSSIQRWQSLKIDYTESQGHPVLREQIAALYPGLTAKNVLVAVPEELIYVAMRTQLKAGDHVVVLSPCYQSLFSIAEEIGCTLSQWFIHEVDGKWTLNVDELAGMITPKTRMLVVNFPNNPTGYLPSEADLRRILSLAEEHGIIVFCDEMYRLLERTETSRLPSASTIYDNVISLSGLSKSFALPGLRLGWVTSRNETILAKMLEYKDYTTICNSAPTELLGIMALEQAERILKRNLDIVNSNINACREAFASLPSQVLWIEPDAGSIAFAKWVGKQDLDEVCEGLIAEHGLMVVQGKYFLTANTHFRVGLGRINFPQALRVFCEAVSALG